MGLICFGWVRCLRCRLQHLQTCSRRFSIEKGGWPLCYVVEGGWRSKGERICGKGRDRRYIQVPNHSGFPKIRSTFQPLKRGNHDACGEKWFLEETKVWEKKCGKMTAVWKKSCSSWDRQNIISITKKRYNWNLIWVSPLPSTKKMDMILVVTGEWFQNLCEQLDVEHLHQLVQDSAYQQYLVLRLQCTILGLFGSVHGEWNNLATKSGNLWPTLRSWDHDIPKFWSILEVNLRSFFGLSIHLGEVGSLISGSDFAIPSLQLLKVFQVEGKKTSTLMKQPPVWDTHHHPPPLPPTTTSTHHHPPHPPPPTTTHHHHPPPPTTTTHHHPSTPPTTPSSTCFSFALLHHVVGLLSWQLRAEWQLAPAAYQAFQVI